MVDLDSEENSNKQKSFKSNQYDEIDPPMISVSIHKNHNEEQLNIIGVEYPILDNFEEINIRHVSIGFNIDSCLICFN